MCVCVMAIFGHYKDNLLFYGVIRETMLELAKCQFGLISKLRRSVGWGGGGGVGSRLSAAEKEVLLMFCVHAIQSWLYLYVNF